MSVQNPISEVEKDAAEWAEKFTLEEALAEGRKLRDKELDLHDQLALVRAQLDPLNEALRIIQHRLEAIKYKMSRDL